MARFRWYCICWPLTSGLCKRQQTSRAFGSGCTRRCAKNWAADIHGTSGRNRRSVAEYLFSLGINVGELFSPAKLDVCKTFKEWARDRERIVKLALSGTID